MVALGVLAAARDRYLSHTSIELEMRGSITTLLGYVGGIIVVASALSALGIRQIAIQEESRCNSSAIQ